MSIISWFISWFVISWKTYFDSTKWNSSSMVLRCYIIMYFSRSKKRDTHREFRMEALLQTDGSLVLGVSLCGDDANAWRDFCFLNCNKKFLCLSASLVDFLHAFTSSRQPNSRQLPSEPSKKSWFKVPLLQQNLGYISIYPIDYRLRMSKSR